MLQITNYLPKNCMQYTVLSVFANSRKLKRLDYVSSFQTFPRTSKNHLPPLYRNILGYNQTNPVTKTVFVDINYYNIL